MHIPIVILVGFFFGFFFFFFLSFFFEIIFSSIHQQNSEAAAQRCSRKRYSENKQQMYKKTPMPKYNFIEIAPGCF